MKAELFDRKKRPKNTRPAKTMKQACVCFTNCDSPICPLKVETWKNTWRIDQHFCRLFKMKDTPLIRRQRELKKLQPVQFVGVDLDYEYLIETAPKLEE